MRHFIRVLLTLVCLFFMTGTGLCSVVGLGLSVQNPDPIVLLLTLVGLALAVTCAFAVYRIWNPKR